MPISSRRVAVWHIAVVVGRLAFLLTGWIEGLDRCIAQLNSTADPGGIVRGGGWCRLPTPLVGSCAVARHGDQRQDGSPDGGVRAAGGSRTAFGGFCDLPTDLPTGR